MPLDSFLSGHHHVAQIVGILNSVVYSFTNYTRYPKNTPSVQFFLQFVLAATLPL